MSKTTHQQTPTPRPRGPEPPDDADPARRLWSLWRQGQQPRVADFLDQAGVRDPEEIVMALRVDQAEHRRLGQWVPAEQYLAAFPAVRDDPAATVDLVFAEYLLREEGGERPLLEEFVRRFPQHAEELKLQIELHREIDGDRAPTATGPAAAATLAMEGGTTPADRPTGYPEIPGYEVLGVLGRGGMGIVYRARQIELKRPVALKMLIAGALASPEAAARFRVEVEAMARLRHPNIAQIHAVGQHAGAPFLVLELVEGRSLAQVLASTPQPADWSARTTEALARAIHAAHLLGVLHRDISPANILMADDGTPKVTDFGLAKLTMGGGSLRTQTGDLLGTPSYMSPEQAAGSHRSVGEATDIYALGAIIYEMLTGRPPFKAEEPLETLRQVISDEPVTPSRLRPRLPRDLETICLKCLHKEPGRRYASALALADDLRRYLEGRPIVARRSTALERSWRWCRRNPWPAAAAALMTIVAVGSALAAWQFRRDGLRIQAAGRETRLALFESLVSQAQVRRFSHRDGQRFASLDAVDQAAKIGRELNLPADRFDQLRDEAIACMTLPDMRATGRVIPRPPGVILIAFDPTMTRYALRFNDGTIAIRRVADDAEIDRFAARGDRHVYVFRFSPDGRYLATTHFPGFALTVREIDRGSVALDDPGPVEGAAARFSPDSRRIALCRHDGSTVLDDLATGQPCGSWAGPAPGNDLAFRADGAWIAAIYNERRNPTCRIVESDTGHQVGKPIALPSPGTQVAWGPDGTTVATACSDLKIYLWDAVTGRRKVVLEGSTNAGLISAFHPSGTVLASNGWEARLRLWDPILGRPLLSLTAALNSQQEFSRDGHLIVLNEDALTTYEVDPALEYRTLAHPSGDPGNFFGASICRDGRMLAVSTDRSVVLWDLARGEELASLAIGKTADVLFEASGDLLTLVWDQSLAYRWPIRHDPDRGIVRIGPPRPAPGLARDRSGRTAARAARPYGYASVATPTGTIRVGPLDDCRHVAVSPDGRWLATGSHGKTGFQVWQLPGGEPVADRKIEGLVKVAFSPDGKWLMTTPSPCQLWAVGTWDEVRRIDGVGLGFSPDGRYLLTQDAKRVLHLVEPETGRTVARLESPDSCGVEGAAFSPDGSRLAVTTQEGPAVHVWDLRAIRRRLATVHLDWEAAAEPAIDPAALAAPPHPWTAVVDLGGLGDAWSLLQQLQAEQTAGKTVEQIDLADVASLTKLATIYQSAGRTREAVPLLAKAYAANPKDTMFSVKVAALQAWFGQEKELAATRERIQAIAKETSDSGVAERAAKACSIVPNTDKAQLEAALALARNGVELNKGGEWQDWHLLALGMAEYRKGNDAAALLALAAAEQAGPNVNGISAFYRAMSLFRQGKKDQARKVAIAALANMKPLPADEQNPLAGGASDNDLISWLAYKEAKAMIQFDVGTPAKAQTDKQ
jgi:WD40 repeat protein